MERSRNDVRDFVLKLFEIAESQRLESIAFFAVQRELQDIRDMLTGYTYSLNKWGGMFKIELWVNSHKTITLADILKDE